MTPRKVTFVGVPLDLGAGRRGVDMGPSALRGAEIHARVRELGYEVADHGDMKVSIAETRDPGDPSSSLALAGQTDICFRSICIHHFIVSV